MVETTIQLSLAAPDFYTADVSLRLELEAQAAEQKVSVRTVSIWRNPMYQDRWELIARCGASA